MSTYIYDTILQAINDLPVIPKKIYIAYSGGLDSTVLLHSTIRCMTSPSIINHKFKLYAVHVNHNLNYMSQKWQSHCQNFCLKNNIEFIEANISLDETSIGSSIENAARIKRYAVMKNFITNKDEVLFTAHHALDQTETVLFNLFRGSGIRGLSGMKKIKPFAKGYHLRPFLEIDRQVIMDYATVNELDYINDSSNYNTNFIRNYIRHCVLPIIQRKWPNCVQNINRAASHCRSTDDFVIKNFKYFIIRNKNNSDKAKDPVSLERSDFVDIDFLCNLDKTSRAYFLREWVLNFNTYPPDTKSIQEIEKSMLYSAKDKNPIIKIGDIEIRKYDKKLWILKQKYNLLSNSSLKLHKFKLSLQCEEEIDLFGVCQIKLIKHKTNVLNNDQKENKKYYLFDFDKLFEIKEHLYIGFRTDGLKFEYKHKLGDNLFENRNHKLKKLLQTWRVPPWIRSTVPLVYFDDKIIGVLGYSIHHDFAIHNSTKNFLEFKQI